MTQRPKDDVVEELYEDKPTGVEVEGESDTPGDGEIVRPYNPSLIRVDPKMFSLRNILDMIDEGDLDLAPDFQRLRVWKPWQRSRLIESILLRIPLPAFYFSSDADGRMLVVDGVQRLTTIFDFVRGGADGKSHFVLSDLEYLETELGGKRYSDIEGTNWAKRINGTQIVANVIDPQTPNEVKFDIFRRINTGGTPLAAQEIRHCMSGPRSRALLKTLSQSKEFDVATGGKLSGHPRMADREMVLRVLAFRLLGESSEYSKISSLEEFLNSATEEIDGNLRDAEVTKLSNEFLRAMKVARGLFGMHAFRKWPPNSDWRLPINRALFEVWGVLLSDFDEQTLLNAKKELLTSYRSLFVSDNFFVSSISTGTGDPKKIIYRFGVVRNLLAKYVK
jgi:hypothetical protein